MAFREHGLVHVQVPVPSPNLLKSSTSYDTSYDSTIPGLRAVARRFSIGKADITPIEATCEVVCSEEVGKEEGHLILTGKDESMIVTEEISTTQSKPSKIKLTDLPEEVQQNILGFLLGDLGSISSKFSGTGVRNWHYALRHSRARDLASLALVTPQWTGLIQQRLYRHIRIQGTREGISDCYEWFITHPHLQEHVRHVDFWVPVWEKRGIHNAKTTPARSMIPTDNLHLAEIVQPDLHMSDNMPISSNYQLSSQGSTIEEMFQLIKGVFEHACIVTIEGGSCKKPPRIPLVRSGAEHLPELPKIRTLVLKGAWTMIRGDDDYQVLSKALPNLKDWQCMFAAPKYKAYVTMYSLMPHLSSQLTHLHLCMDGFYSKKWLGHAKVDDLHASYHLCTTLGHLLAQLEALTYSGRACSSIFTAAVAACKRRPDSAAPRLKSLDIALRNSCKDPAYYTSDMLSSYAWHCIPAFERLIMSATTSLTTFINLKNLRIRYVDLDSPLAYLSPYFMMKENVAYGLYNEAIVSNLADARPPVSMAQESGLPREHNPFYVHARRAGRRPNVIHVSEYTSLRG